MDKNQILINVDEKILYDALIFNKSSYIDYLKIMLNDSTFLNDISNESAFLKLKHLKEIEDEFKIELNAGKEYLSLLIEKQDVKEKLSCLDDEIETLYYEFRSDRSGEKFNDISNQLEALSDRLNQIESNTLDNESISKYHLLCDRVNTFKQELTTILDTFITDDRYESIVKNLFENGRLWQNPYGTYNNNPFINKEKEKEDSNIEYEFLVKCSYLPKLKYQTPQTKIFNPLVFQEYLFISKDAKSITCINNKEVLFTIPLKDEIVASGAIMFFKNIYYLVIPCRYSIKILNQNGIIKEIPYEKVVDGIIVKGITVFNNVCYVLTTSYLENKSKVYLIKYDFYKKEFTYRNPLIFETTILSNVFIVNNYQDNKFYAGYIDSDLKLSLADLDSLDSVLSYRISLAPIDMGFSINVNSNLIECKYYYPISVNDGIIYYLAYSKNDELFLCIVDPITQKEDKILLPRYAKKLSNNGGFMQTFTNIVIKNDKVYLCGISDHELCEISLFKNTLKTKPISPKRKNSLLVAYQNNCYLIDEKDNPSQYGDYTIVGVWNNKIITKEALKDEYNIFVEK